MAKIIDFSDYVNRDSDNIKQKIAKRVTEIEEELGIEPLTVLTETAALNLANYLFDIKDGLEGAMEAINLEESESIDLEE